MNEINDNETVYRKPKFWRKGNSVSVFDDTLHIRIGGNEEAGSKKQKKTNRIVSTKYTLLTFVPQNLFEQFRRIANFYFLVMAIIAISIDSPVSPLTSVIPLVFVISVTAAKQAYEDFLRHRADNMVNRSYVTLIRNGVELDIQCEDIHLGDLVKVPRNCDVPCDLILLKSSDVNGKCNITTANLDGETNLKTLLIPKGLPTIELNKLHTLGYIECESPTTDLYSFNGRVELSSSFKRISEITTELDQQTYRHLPLMAENLMLRGSRVKNTDWAVGCAVYTGQYTKLALNSKITSSKMSSSEQFINKYLIFFLVLLTAIVTVCYFMKRYFDEFHSEHQSYMGPVEPLYQVTAFLQDYFSFLIIFNYLIPISLYVTIEMHKFLGSFFMEWDPELYDEETNQTCIVNTSDINEELGQVNFLFSDKTGTLTKNIMIFKSCSINGKMYSQQGRGLKENGRNYSLKVGECSKAVYTFFEALAVCHTVQVGGKYNEDEDKADEENNLPSIYTDVPEVFQNILEENATTEDETEPDFVRPNSQISNIESQALNADRPFSDVVIKRINRNLLSRPLSLTENVPNHNNQKSNHHVHFDLDDLKDLTLPPRIQAMDFKRGVHNVTDGPKNGHLTHRRTQSSVPFGNSSPAITTTHQFQRNGTLRSSTREYYAAPSYNTASLVERNESMMGNREIETFIDKLDYQASSPDEKALVEICAKLGLIYLNDFNEILTIKLRIKKQTQPVSADTVDANEDIIHFKRLQVLEFTSDRKRMSVIAMDRNGQIWIYTKGAESHVLPLCNGKNSIMAISTLRHINEFAKEGLRTLAIARKKLSKVEFINFNNELMEANSSLTNRAELVELCQRKVETGLDLLGATAVEDALQDNVRDTLVSLRAAGIRVWVLTGDKVETALNIALSCGHIPEDAGKYFITGCENEIQINGHLDTFQGELETNSETQFALLIDGPSLAIALKYASVRFRDLAVKCHAVLCCRLSPLQKCEVVALVKTVTPSPITAAIGDGANDVAMILEAHVGLGLVGKEGRQAARCADYAFSNFSMVKRILLVHGYYFSHRLSLLVLYFFYKNLVFMGCQLFFQINSMFSSNSVYDSLFLTLYNLTYTSLPVLFISLTEKRFTEEKLLNEPYLYRGITHNKLFSWKYFIGWMILAIYHSVIIYSFSYIIWASNSAIFSSMMVVGLSCFGTFLIHNVVVLVNLKLLIETVYKSYIFIGTIWLSIFGFIGTTFVYNLFDVGYDGNLFMVYSNLLSSATFWAGSTLIMIACLIPDLTIRALEAFNFKFKSIFPGNAEMHTINPARVRSTETTHL